MRKGNEPAFPLGSGDVRDHMGMTLRDYFAAKAMQSVLSVLYEGIRPEDVAVLARDVYGIADAMLAERTREGQL
jgi:hypothetical protein